MIHNRIHFGSVKKSSHSLFTPMKIRVAPHRTYHIHTDYKLNHHTNQLYVPVLLSKYIIVILTYICIETCIKLRVSVSQCE